MFYINEQAMIELAPVTIPPLYYNIITATLIEERFLLPYIHQSETATSLCVKMSSFSVGTETNAIHCNCSGLYMFSFLNSCGCFTHVKHC